ncbi:MAG: hypothetical protein Q8R39_02740 [bacterium]|nr:hypothetical protein [bacterium]MDZ4284474.1 hypothetical protein [Patescibacteria group bacterium]
MGRTVFQKTARRGFSILELLLYVLVLSLIVGSFGALLSLLLRARVKQQAILEVEQQGHAVLELMRQTVRNASAVLLPPVGASESSLTLDVVDIAKDPTVFNSASGVLYITEGAGAPIALTSSRVSLSDVTFRHLEQDTEADSVRIQFTLSHVNPAGTAEYAYVKTFYGSALLGPSQ